MPRLLVIGGGPGGYVCRDPRRATWDRHGDGGAGRPGRHLPERRLHPLEGADPRGWQSSPTSRISPPAPARWDCVAGRRDSTGQDDALEGRHRRAAEHRRRRAAEAGRGQGGRGWAAFLDGKTVEVETEIGRQIIRAEQVVIATGSVRLNCRRCRSAGRSSPRPKR